MVFNQTVVTACLWKHLQYLKFSGSGKALFSNSKKAKATVSLTLQKFLLRGSWQKREYPSSMLLVLGRLQRLRAQAIEIYFTLFNHN